MACAVAKKGEAAEPLAVTRVAAATLGRAASRCVGATSTNTIRRCSMPSTPYVDGLSRVMPTVFVAAPAGRHLVLEPAWTALDPRHEVFRRWLGPPVVKRRATPNTNLAVSGHGLIKSCTAPSLPNYTVLRRLLSSPH